MNRETLDYLAKKLRKMDDNRRGRDSESRGSRRGRDYRSDYREGRDDYRRDMRDYEDSRDYHKGRYYGEYEDSRDYEDGRDYHDVPPRLSKSDAKRWKKMMENFDGTRGEHYSSEQTEEVAEKLGISFDEYSEMDFCLTVNMMYSDYGHVLKKYVSPDKELHVCAELAKAFLEDPDGPDPSEKLALYFHCIVSPDV